MAYDWFRAVQQWADNMMHSDLAYLITEAGLLAVVQTHKPNLYPYVKDNFGPVWRWIRDNLF
jgi:hypothetical protein